MLSDVKEVVIKPGALELAQALNDVMDVLKNPSGAYKQLAEKHTALQTTVKEHSGILAKNEQVLAEHKDSRIKQSVESQKHQKELDEKLSTMRDLQKSLDSRDTSLKVRETALQSRDKAITDKEKTLSVKEVTLTNRETSLIAREKAVKERNAELDRQLDSLHAKHDELKKVIG